MRPNIRYPGIFCLIIGCLALLPACGADNSLNSLKAGTARQAITPEEPLPMWGYTERHDLLSTGVLDPLYATALVIQLDGKKIAVVSLDLGRTPGEKTLENIRRRFKHDAGIEYSFIAASHTHHGPVLELSDEAGLGRGRFAPAFRYYSQLENAVVRAVAQANESLTPAKMAVGSTQLDGFNVNRHSGLTPAPRDPDLVVMRFDTLNGAPLAMIVNFAAHPTLIPPRVLKFSADYVGSLRRTVEQGMGVKVLFTQGAAGDLSPTDNKDCGEFGRDLGKEVLKFAATLKSQENSHPTLKIRQKTFRFKSRLDLNDPTVRRQCNELFFPELVANYAKQFSAGIETQLSVGLFNDEIAVVGVSGEFFSSHSMRLKERARVKQVLFLGYCNGYSGYFPTIEAFAEGGYGTENIAAPAEIDAGEQVMNTALIWIYEMLGNIREADR